MYIINYILQFEEKRRKEKRHCHRTHRHEEFARHISYLDPSTHDGHSVRSRKYIERHIRGCGHVRIFVFGRDHVWIKWRHGTPAGADIHRSLRGLAVPIPQQLVARSLARGQEKSWRASVCAWATYTLVRSWRGEGGYLEYVSRYASLSCIGTSRVSLSSVETQRAGRVVSEVRLNWKFYS